MKLTTKSKIGIIVTSLILLGLMFVVYSSNSGSRVETNTIQTTMDGVDSNNMTIYVDADATGDNDGSSWGHAYTSLAIM